MVYTKQTWVNSTSTPLNATRLTKLETQYDEAKTYTDTLFATIPSPAVVDYNVVGDLVRSWTGSAWPAINLPSGYTGPVTWRSWYDDAAPAPSAAREDLDVWERKKPA